MSTERHKSIPRGADSAPPDLCPPDLCPPEAPPRGVRASSRRSAWYGVLVPLLLGCAAWTVQLLMAAVAAEVILTLPSAPIPCKAGQTCTYDPGRYSTAQLDGNQAASALGSALVVADLDGNGIDDIVLGSPNSRSSAGDIYIRYGTPSPPNGIVPVSGLVNIYGKAAAGFFGSSLAAGDLNRDGYDDLVIGASGDDSGRGKVYILLGGRARSSGLIGDQGDLLVVTTSSSIAQLGASVAVGDVTGDGGLDLLAGAPGISRVGLFSELGTNNHFEDAFLFQGPSGSNFGQRVAEVGALTGDSTGDLAIAATISGSTGGELWIINGRSLNEFKNAAGSYLWNLSSNPSSGAGVKRFTCDLKVDSKTVGALGTAVAGVGDLNLDGFPDLVVGAPTAAAGDASNVIREAGRLYLIFGSSALYDKTTAQISGVGTYLMGSGNGHHFGSSTSRAVNSNADKYPDLIVGAPDYIPPGSSLAVGAAYLIPGGSTATWPSNGQAVTDRSPLLLVGSTTSERTGAMVFAAPSFNLDGDKLGDVLVAAPLFNVNPNRQEGRVYYLNITDLIDNDGDGQTRAGGDCDNSSISVYYDASGRNEVCDGLDNDCDTLIDDSDPSIHGDYVFYLDEDGDGFGGATSITRCASTPPTGTTLTSEDCDDRSISIYPGAPEICDGVDNDCDALLDDQDVLAVVPYQHYPDQDGDGHGAGTPLPSCSSNPPTGYSASSSDCDDSNKYIHPGSAEVCDGIDNNCDELIDAKDPVFEGEVTYYEDSDGDGFGTLDETSTGCSAEAPDGYSRDAGDCDDDDASAYPGAPEGSSTDPLQGCLIGDGRDNDCNGAVDEGTCSSDDDGDGQSETAGDCNDQDPSTYSGAIELCDETDHDCDGNTLNGLDLDGDGYPSGCAAGNLPNDCDDQAKTTYPGAVELCDGKDNNCDDAIDEGFDADGDSYPSAERCAGLNAPLDCDDQDATVNPGASERCDDRDQDCDGDTYNGFDLDDDGFPAGSGCAIDEALDCNDQDADIHPGAEEQCDGIDNNCVDGLEDERIDADRDGHSTCVVGTSEVADCDDADNDIYPGADELCNGDDNDCDGVVDADGETFDVDEDGYPSAALCASLSGTRELDCNDADAAVYPGADEPAGSTTDLNCDEQLEPPVESPTPGQQVFVDDALGCACRQTVPQVPSNPPGSGLVSVAGLLGALLFLRRRQQVAAPGQE